MLKIVEQNKNIQDCVSYITEKLLNAGVIIQIYEAYSTSSVYLKFDCGLANSLRIGDHRGKKHLNYMFQVDVNHKGKRKIKRGSYTQYIYSSKKSELDKLVTQILKHRENKIDSYFGYDIYKQCMKDLYKKNRYSKGFWSQATFIKRREKIK
ncbi:TPA: hypothetical protein KJK14_002819 [Enterococcus faecalis]|nr:hypothetical protein [Enterococcus faecalis]HBD4332729.1 hypothetical protein [Enterococcus faecalis]